MTSDPNASRVGTVLTSYIIPIPLMVLATGLRLYVKLRRKKGDRIAIDDILITLATICAVGECTVGLFNGVPHGFGKHIDTVSPEDIRMFHLGNYMFSHFYNITLGLTKLAILAFYYRIFITTLFRRIILLTATFIILWILTITIIFALQCRPIRRFWNPHITGTCFSLVGSSYFTNISNLATDIWIFLLPIPLILHLQLSLYRKLGICGVFMVGLATCIISSVRLSCVAAQGSSDVTWDLVPLGALSVFESLGGILSANLPVTYVLFANFIRDLKKILSSIVSTKLKPHEPHFHDPAMFHTGRTINAGAKPWIQLPASGYSVDSKPSDLSDIILKNNSRSGDNGNSDFLIIEKGSH